MSCFDDGSRKRIPLMGKEEDQKKYAKTEKKFGWEELPEDVQGLILSFISFEDLLLLRVLNKGMKGAVNSVMERNSLMVDLPIENKNRHGGQSNFGDGMIGLKNGWSETLEHKDMLVEEAQCFVRQHNKPLSAERFLSNIDEYTREQIRIEDCDGMIVRNTLKVDKIKKVSIRDAMYNVDWMVRCFGWDKRLGSRVDWNEVKRVLFGLLIAASDISFAGYKYKLQFDPELSWSLNCSYNLACFEGGKHIGDSRCRPQELV